MSKQEQNPVDFKFAEQYPELAPENTLVLHENFNLFDLQKYLPNARRLAANFQTGDSESYFKYVLDRKAENEDSQKSRTFINAFNPESSLTATTILNFGTSENAGHGDDRAVLDLSRDPMFEEFYEAFNDKWYKANKLAETLETFLGTAEMFGTVDGEEGRLHISAVISSFRNLKVEANHTNQTTSQSQFKAETSDLESFEAEAVGGALPEYIFFSTPIYAGLEFQDIRFKVIMEKREDENKKPFAVFRLKPIALKYAYHQAAANFRHLVRENLEGEDTYIGSAKV
ncbi:hypothetical protein [Acinetobacter phage vB_AbaS_TCUP2199]|nr:hypothetical protein [Acinetobacter phage vB_AbaS_TCUP2199]